MSIGEEGANRVTVVMGSARGDGNTASAVNHLCRQLGPTVAVADLAALDIEAFEYGRYDDRDDFRAVIRMMLASEHIVFATPVYWYAMSGTMKVFFDRLTDLLVDPADRKTGRALAHRNVWVLATGTEDCLPCGFHVPFERTASYFAMVWRQAFYCRSVEGTPLPTASLAEVETLARLIAT